MTHEAPPKSGGSTNVGLMENLQANRSGALLAGLVAMLISALALSQMVTVDFTDLANYEYTGERIGSWLVIFAGLAVAAVTAYAVRLASPRRNAMSMLIAGVLSWVGVHVMTMVATGTSILNDSGWQGNTDGGAQYVGDSGIGDSLLLSLVLPAFSAGSILAAVAGAIVAGWGDRD